MGFHVYVEGPIEQTPAGVQRLADAMFQRYGLPAADVVARLGRGRFRVKANLDEKTARAYARDLVRVGARAVVEQASETAPVATTSRSEPVSPPPASRVVVAKPPGRPYAIPASSIGKTTPPTGRSAIPSAEQPAPHTTPRTGPSQRAALPAVRPARAIALGDGSASSPPPAASAPAPAAPSAPSDVPAPSSAQAPIASAGAVEPDLLTFASIDGFETGAPSSLVVESDFEPRPARPASPASRPTPAPSRANDIPLDLFEPPDPDGPNLVVELATDELEHQARKRAGTPVPLEAPPFARPIALAGTSPSISRVLQRKAPPSGGPNVPTAVVVAPAPPRWRFAAGVAIAIVLGFIPAHVVAAIREDAAFTSIDTKVEQAQAAADTPEAYEDLDAFRATQLDKKQREHRSITLLSLAIWAAVAGGLAYLWFRRIPWDRLARR